MWGIYIYMGNIGKYREYTIGNIGNTVTIRWLRNGYLVITESVSIGNMLE